MFIIVTVFKGIRSSMDYKVMYNFDNLCCKPEKSVEQAVAQPEISDDMVLIWYHDNVQSLIY